MKRKRRKRPPVSPGFTLLEVLIAFGILFSFLTLLAAGFTRHLEVLQRMERALIAHSLADRELARVAVERQEKASFEEDLPAGYSVERQAEPVVLEIGPSRRVDLERVSAHCSWSFRERGYTESVSAGFRLPEDPAAS